MRLLILIMALVLLPVSGWGATYSVCGSGCDYTTVAGAFAGRDLAPGDIVEVRADTPGGSKTYTESVTWGSNDGGGVGNPVTLRGRAGDSVTIDGTTNSSSLYITNLSNLRVENLRVIGGATYTIRVANTSTNIHFENVVAENGAAPLYMQGTPDLITVNKGVFRNSTSSAPLVLTTTGTARLTVNNTIIENGKLQGILIAGTGVSDVAINNSVVSGAVRDGILNSGAGAVVVRNTLVTNANVENSASYYPLNRTSTGSLTYTNSIIQPDYRKFEIANGSTDGGNNTHRTPGIIRPRRSAIVGFTIDGQPNIGDWAQLADYAMSTYGFRVTITPGTGLCSAGDWSAITSRLPQGHDVHPHGRYGAILTDLNGLRIYYTGAGSTATASISSGTLTTKVDGSTDRTVTLTGKDLTTVATELGTGDYVCTVHHTYGKPGAYNLADISDVNIKIAAPGYAAALSQTRLFNDEITVAKAEIESAIGRSVTTFSYQTGANNSAAQAALLAAGYTGARGIFAGSWRQETGINMYNFRAWGLHSEIGTSNIERRVEAVLDAAMYDGGYVQFYSHDFASVGGTGYSFDNWKKVLSTVAAYMARNPGMVNMNQDDAVAFIRANSTTADNITYTRTFTNNSDYRPRSGSPLIGAGTPIAGLTTDYAGKLWKNPPSIGAYEYYRTGGGNKGFSGFNLGFGL